MLFGGNAVKSDHLVILSYMEPLWIISGHYDVTLKKLQKNIFLVIFDIGMIFYDKKCANSIQSCKCFKMICHMTIFKIWP